jgi:hypothetical protein
METSIPFPRQCNRINPLPLILLMLAGIVSAIIYAVAMSEHALSRHGDAALSVYQACEKGPAEYFHRGSRVFSICWVEDKQRWGVVIEEWLGGQHHPVTAILKEKLSKLTDVERWLKNTGATPGLP